MTIPTTSLALCATQQLSDQVPDGAREWLHLLPAGGVVTTMDGRGPYTVGDYHALIAESMKDGAKLVLDENHSTDRAAPKGFSAPAAGWITSLQLREDGVWGEVEYTPLGTRLRAERAYSGISPAIEHTADKKVRAIRRASFVNVPNLKGLTALHSKENDMDWKKMIIEALGLDAGADDEAISAAMKAALDKKPDETALQMALQSALQPIAGALGLGETADAAAIVTAVGTLKEASPAESQAVIALQSELTSTTEQLNELKDSLALQAAETFVDAAIAEGRVGVKPLRDTYIAMHQKDPAQVAQIIGAMPKVGGTQISLQGRDPDNRTTDLDDADRAVIALMGIDPEEFRKTRAAELGVELEAL